MVESWPIWLGIPLFGVGMWMAVSIIVSNIGGWRDLAVEYRASHEFLDNRFSWRSAGMRGRVWYRSCLTMGSSQEGLYVATSPLFRVGHPPLFIPWSDISASPQKVLWMDYVQLGFRRSPDVPFLIRRKLAVQLLAQGPVRVEAA
jgi:hypothetical protein